MNGIPRRSLVAVTSICNKAIRSGSCMETELTSDGWFLKLKELISHKATTKQDFPTAVSPSRTSLKWWTRLSLMVEIQSFSSSMRVIRRTTDNIDSTQYGNSPWPYPYSAGAFIREILCTLNAWLACAPISMKCLITKIQETMGLPPAPLSTNARSDFQIDEVLTPPIRLARPFKKNYHKNRC